MFAGSLEAAAVPGQVRTAAVAAATTLTSRARMNPPAGRIPRRSRLETHTRRLALRGQCGEDGDNGSPIVRPPQAWNGRRRASRARRPDRSGRPGCGRADRGRGVGGEPAEGEQDRRPLPRGPGAQLRGHGGPERRARRRAGHVRPDRAEVRAGRRPVLGPHLRLRGAPWPGGVDRGLAPSPLGAGLPRPRNRARGVRRPLHGRWRRPGAGARPARDRMLPRGAGGDLLVGLDLGRPRLRARRARPGGTRRRRQPREVRGLGDARDAPRAVTETELRERRERLVREHMESENRHEFDVTMATFHHPRYEIVPTGEVHDGEEAVAAYFAESRAAFPDQRNETIALHHADDAVIVEFWLRGTHEGELRGIPPTGRAFEVRCVAFFLFDEDRLVGERVYLDTATILGQLGIGAPAPS